MNPISLLLLALALAMDTFAISIASGLAARRFHVRHALTMGLWFGGFQAIMPVLGWWGGTTVQHWIAAVDHWVAFGLLTFIGAKMIFEAFRIEAVEERMGPPEMRIMFLLAVATSIDALAVGLSLAVLKVVILAPAIIIGVVTFAMSFAGVWIGSLGVRFFEKKIEIIGGLILIGIGLRILIAHTWAVG